jgi:uncharacterized lipoprotein YbaY
MVSGNIIVNNIEEDFKDATIYIELRDVSLMDAPSILISGSVSTDVSASAGESLSIQYSISQPELDEIITYSISAFMDINRYKTVLEKDYISTSHNDVAANSDNLSVIEMDSSEEK